VKSRSRLGFAVALTLGVSVSVACAPAQAPASALVRATGLGVDDEFLRLPARNVDLAGEAPVKPGFGRIRVVVDNSAAGRRTQGTDQYLILAITRPGGEKIKDENGGDAVYSATAVNGVMTITLPGLPTTTTQTSGAQTGAALVINALIGNWDAFAAPTTYAALAAGTLQYGSATATTFVLDNLGKNLVKSTEAANSSSTLLSSGFARADVSAGLVPTVTLSTHLHLQKRFSNWPTTLAPESPTPAELLELVATGSANVTVISSLRSDASGMLRLRHPAFNPDEVDAAPTAVGNIAADRRVARVLVQTADGSPLSSAPRLTVQTYDPTAGTRDGITPPVTDSPFSLNLTTGGSNAAFSLDQTMAWISVDLSGPLAGPTGFSVSDLQPAAYNVLDLTLAGLPASKQLKVYFLPLGTAYIMSGAYTPNRFQ